MNRRTFLNSLLAAASAPWAPAALATATATPPSEARRQRLLQESPLAGFQYHAGERLWPRLTPGAPLTLRREPDNPHDQRAVAILCEDERIGYLPRMENTAVSQLLDRGECLSARIIARNQSRDPWKRLRVAVYWEAAI